MKLIPFALIFASAIFCSTLRNKIDPTPTPLPTLGSTPRPSSTAPLPPAEPGNSAANGVSTPRPLPKSVSGGVLNGKAKTVRASGSVSVQITVDQAGKVISASAVSGHPLLRAAAEQAARKAEFEPTLLSGQPVSVTGVVTYTFKP